MLRRPRALTRNSHLAVLALSSPSDLARIEIGKRNLEARGVRITLADNIDHAGEHGYLAGTDDERLEIANRFLRDPQYDGYLFARGGYGAMRILDRIDYDAIAANPRPIIGFSDLTALHQAMAIRANVASFHGPMVNLDFHDGLSPENEAWFWSMLTGEAPLAFRFDGGEGRRTSSSAPRSGPKPQVIIEGEAEGELFGGCLSLTEALAPTPYDYWPDNGIWFWEEVEERPYRIDRMLTTLRLSGRLKAVRGVVVGRLKNCGSDEEINALLREFFAPLSIPVVRDLPFGHYGDNLLMPFGAPAHLSTSDGSLTIPAPVVER